MNNNDIQKTRTQRWNELKPERPKMPPKKFGLFVSEFSRRKDSDKLHGPDLIRAASEAWKNLGDEAKNQFENADAVANYQDAMANYNRTMAALKRPAESYPLYVQQYWKTAEPKPKCQGLKDFKKIQKTIAKKWAEASDYEKCAYKAASNLGKQLFRREQDAVLSGARPLNLNWRPNGCEVVCRILQANQGQGQDAAVGANRVALPRVRSEQPLHQDKKRRKRNDEDDSDDENEE